MNELNDTRFNVRDLDIYKNFIVDTDSYELVMSEIKKSNESGRLSKDISEYERVAQRFLVRNLYRNAVNRAKSMNFSTLKDEDKKVIGYEQDSNDYSELSDLISAFNLRASIYGLNEKSIEKAVGYIHSLAEKKKSAVIERYEERHMKNKNGNGDNGNDKTEGNGGGK